MDITGGTQSSGGLFSPTGASKRITIYDPSYHRWMATKSLQGRNIHTAHTVLPHKPNNRYLQVRYIKLVKWLKIVNVVIKESLQQRLAPWLEKLSEDNKKGLRLMSKVMEVDGKKRFKKDDHGHQLKHDMLVKDVYAVPIEDAQKEYRKLTNKSNYS